MPWRVGAQPEAGIWFTDGWFVIAAAPRRLGVCRFLEGMKARKHAGGQTDHVHDLDQAEREDHRQGLRVVGHRPLHPVVVLQEVLQQAPLVGALQGHYEG